MSSAATFPDCTTASGRPDESQWPSLFRPVLSRLAADGHRYFGFDGITIEAVRHVDRPFSTLLQIRVASGPHVSDAFVKVLKPRWNSPDQIESMQRNVIKEFEMTDRVHQALKPHAGLSAVRPIACFPDQLTLVTAQASGPTLTDVLGRRATRWSRAGSAGGDSSGLQLAGRWLKVAQTRLSEDRDLDVDAMRTYLNRRLADLERIGPLRLTRPGRLAIERARDRLIGEAGERNFKQFWIHADFCPDNIIASGGQITVLDFTMAKTGTKYHDLAHLFLRIESMRTKPWFRPATIDRFQRELLHAFEPGLDPDRPLFALMLLQHVLCDLVTLQTSMDRASQVLARWLHRRHRRWLDRVAGLAGEGWMR